jgi:hypothetical protein
VQCQYDFSYNFIILNFICIELDLDCFSYNFSCYVFVYMVHYILVPLISVVDHLFKYFEFTYDTRYLVTPFTEDWNFFHFQLFEHSKVT